MKNEHQILANFINSLGSRAKQHQHQIDIDQGRVVTLKNLTDELEKVLISIIRESKKGEEKK